LVKFDPLQRYLSEISQYRLLTREEEVELGKRVQEEEDMEAAYQLVTSNLRLVVKIALEFQRVWMQNLLDSDSGREYRAHAGRQEIRSL
jgi:RNA polymerase sigma-32 factor